MTERRLWNAETGEIRPYPRGDGQEVVGLATPPWESMQVVRLDPPVYNLAIETIVENVETDSQERIIFYGWRDIPRPPNYRGFYDALIESPVYQNVLSITNKTGDQATAISIFSTALIQSINSAENRPALQAAIWNLIGEVQSQLLQEDFNAIQLLMDQHNLSAYFTLAPPDY